MKFKSVNELMKAHENGEILFDEFKIYYPHLKSLETYQQFVTSAQTKIMDLNDCINQWNNEIANIRVFLTKLEEDANK